MTDIAIVRPEGETDYVCRIPAEIVEKYADWTEVVAFRLRKIDDTQVEIELTNDLERITDPEADSAA